MHSQRQKPQQKQDSPQYMRLEGGIMSSMVIASGFFGRTMSIIWHSTSWN